MRGCSRPGPPRTHLLVRGGGDAPFLLASLLQLSLPQTKPSAKAKRHQFRVEKYASPPCDLGCHPRVGGGHGEPVRVPERM